MGALAYAMYHLSAMMKHTGIKAAATALGSLVFGLIAITKITKVIINMKSTTWKELLPKIVALAAVVGALGGLAYALYQLSKIEVPGRVWSSLGALTVGMVVITALTAVFAGMGKILDWKQTLSVIGIVGSMCGLLYVLAQSLVKLAELDQGDLKTARENLDLVLLAIGGLVLEFGIIQGILFGIGSGLGSAAGGWAGAVAVPLLILSIGAAFISTSVALKIGAGAIDILVTALAKLTVVLREIAKLPLEDTVKNLSALPKPLALVGLALIVFGAGAIVGGAGIIVLAYGLERLNPLLGDFAEGMNTLTEVDIGAVAKDLLILAIAGAALGSSAGDVATFAVALSSLATAASAYQASKGSGAATQTEKHPLSHLPSFEYIQKEEEAAETHTVQMQKNNAENTRIYESGVLERVDIAQEGSDKIVEIADEEVAKTNSIFEKVGTEGGQKMQDSMVEGTQKAMDKTAEVAEEGSKKVADKMSTGFERFMGTAETSTPLERKIDATIDKVGSKATEAMGTIQTAIDEKGGVLEALGSLIGDVTGLNMGEGIVGGVLNGIGTALGLINQFDQTIGQYGGNGMPSYIASMKEYSGLYNKHKASAKEFHIEQLKFDKLLGEDFVLGKDFMNQFTEATSQGAGALEDFDEAAGKAGKSAKEMAKDLKSTIENQLDIFSKFEIKTGVTGKQMIENMRSNIDGFASWSHRMAVLAQRFAEAGIDKGLYQKLAELGPKGYETMNAFYEMSAEELAEVKDLYATSLTLPQSQADIVGAGYEYMGQMAVQGFSNALDDHMAAHEAIHGFTGDVIKTAEEDLGVQSPSVVFFDIAYNCLLGYRDGLNASAQYPKKAMEDFIFDVILAMVEENLSYEAFYTYGSLILEGLADGLANEAMMEKLSKSVLTLTELINLTVEEEEDMGSPSKLMKRYGRYISEGLAIGIVDAADNVRTAAEYVTSVANDAMEYGISNLQNVSDLSTALLLTPIVDMDYLDEQLSGIDETIGVNGQNRGNFSATPTETSVSFTQNNYSPKALSRIDIYRQTKNQVSMMKGVVAANA